MEVVDADWGSLLTQFSVATIPALVAYLGVRATNKTKRRTSQGPEWAQYAESLRSDMRDYREQIVDLSSRLSDVECEVRDLRRRYRGALFHIEELRREWPHDMPPPDPPAAIEGDI